MASKNIPAISEETSISNSSLYQTLQNNFEQNFTDIFDNDLVEKTVVIIPSLTLDNEILRSIQGLVYYEERMLCMLMLLRMPRTHVIYISSIPVDNTIIDYYLHLLPGITGYHAAQRLTMLSCYDASFKPLTNKILERPRLIKRIKEHIKNPHLSHMACFNVTEYEKQLAVELGIPIYGCDPALVYLGTKSGCRKIFKQLDILLAHGFEDLQNEMDIAHAFAKLKKQNPALKKAVVKMNDGFSGEGNALFYYQDMDPDEDNLEEAILKAMPQQLKIVAPNVSYERFIEKFCSMGGIAEEFLDGSIKESPSVQCRINPLGEAEIISTHDQMLGGESGQVFLGATFPAHHEYNNAIAAISKKVADEMSRQGVIGRFSIDFLSVKDDNGWKHYAIEINLRKGGTTHPFIMLQFLTGGEYKWQQGVYIMPNGQSRCYFASDNVVNEKYKGLTPHDLIDIAMCNHILYDGASQCGVMFHMIGALSQYGKLGMLCIGNTIEEATAYYKKAIDVLDKECSA